MDPPSATNELRAVRIRIRCRDEREFEERFTPWYAAAGVLLPAELHVREGTILRVFIELSDGRRVFSGTARVDAKVKAPVGTQLRILRVDTESIPLAPVLTPVEQPSVRAGAPPPPLPSVGLREMLFADLPPPEEYAASRPLVIRSSGVRLRLRPTEDE